MVWSNWTSLGGKKKLNLNLNHTPYPKSSKIYHVLKHKIECYKTFRGKNRENSSGTRARQRVLRLSTKSITYKRKNWKLNFIKIKNSCSAKDPVKRLKRQDIDWEEIFQINKGLVEYIKNSQTKQQTIHLENRQKTCTDVSLKRIHKWQKTREKIFKSLAI